MQDLDHINIYLNRDIVEMAFMSRVQIARSNKDPLLMCVSVCVCVCVCDSYYTKDPLYSIHDSSSLKDDTEITIYQLQCVMAYKIRNNPYMPIT